VTATLATDAYKFSMGQAGFPLRHESFYFSFRRGGPQYVAIDLATTVAALVDAIEIDEADLEFARRSGYGLSDAMERALRDGSAALEIVAVPPGTWVLEREPILAVSGPSFLVSWLEPMLLWLNYPIQLATALELGQVTPPMRVATCGEHEAIMRRVAAEVGAAELDVVREDEAYRERVRKAVDAAARGLRERGFAVRVLAAATAPIGGAAGEAASKADLQSCGVEWVE
jgi:nicotinic acid phosphoribosyltransferase